VDFLLVIIFFGIFPVVGLYFLLYFVRNYKKVTLLEEPEEKIVRITSKVRVRMLESVVHELGNCATSLIPMFENIKILMRQKGVVDNRVDQDLAIIYQLLNKIVETKYDASIFSQLIGDRAQFVNVNECVRACWQVMRHDRRTQGVSLNLNLANDVKMLNMSSGSLMSVIINLLSNSLDALQDIDNEKNITIESSDVGESVIVKVIDTGVGMSKDVLDMITTPYYTTKEKGVGTGLGLHVIQEVMNGVGGKLKIESKELVGTIVSLEFRNNI